MSITIQKCSCGHKSCSYWFLDGIGNFYQGTGFEKEEAQAIADFFNKVVENDAAVQIAEEAFRAGFTAARDLSSRGDVGGAAWVIEEERAWSTFKPSEKMKDLTR